MPTAANWSAWNKFYVASFFLYSAFVGVIGTTVFVSALRLHSPITASDFVTQALIILFPATLILGIRKPRFASGILFAAAATNLALTLLANAHVASMQHGALDASLLFLGFPMLASAIVFHLVSRTHKLIS